MDERFTWIEARIEDGVTRVSGSHHARFGHSVLDEDGRECGVAGGWAWDEETLSIENDLHGYLPLYFHLASDRILVSDSPLSIVSRLERPELDPLDHHGQWVDACLGKGKPGSPFSFGGPLCEALQLGVVASRYPGRKLNWNPGSMNITNLPEANQYLSREYRAF